MQKSSAHKARPQAVRRPHSSPPAPPREPAITTVNRTELTISWRTIVQLLLAILLACALVQWWHLLADLVLAMLIGVTLSPVLAWTRKCRGPDWAGVVLCTVILFGGVAVLALWLLPTVGRQVGSLIESLPSLKAQVLRQVPAIGPLHDATEQLFAEPFSDPASLQKTTMAWSAVMAKGVIEFVLILVASLYFLADGERVYHWLLAFLPPNQRRKVQRAAPEVSHVIIAYMGGQLITSLLAGGFAFTVLSLLRVPNAALFAMLAALFDVLPLIGFFLFIVPATLAALTVSPTAALIVAICYSAYHLLENYLIVPKVYGQQLRLSGLTVLICCLLGGAVAGVIGIIVVLPIVASYPIVERLWLKRRLEPDTVERHEDIDNGASVSPPGATE